MSEFHNVLSIDDVKSLKGGQLPPFTFSRRSLSNHSMLSEFHSLPSVGVVRSFNGERLPQFTFSRRCQIIQWRANSTSLQVMLFSQIYLYTHIKLSHSYFLRLKKIKSCYMINRPPVSKIGASKYEQLWKCKQLNQNKRKNPVFFTIPGRLERRLP